MLRGKAWLPGQTQGLCFRIQVHDNQSPWKQGAPVCLAKILVSTNGLSCSSFQQKIVANEGFSSESQTKKSKNLRIVVDFIAGKEDNPSIAGGFYCWWILLLRILVDLMMQNSQKMAVSKRPSHPVVQEILKSTLTCAKVHGQNPIRLDRWLTSGSIKEILTPNWQLPFVTHHPRLV